MDLTTKAMPVFSDSDSLNREDMVRWAYRLFLDREPENESVLSGRSQETVSLRAEFMTSEEFIVKNVHFSMLYDDWIIKQTKYGFRLFVWLREIAICRNIILDNYENAEASFIRSVVGPGDRVVDIGANIGFHTMLLSSIVGPAGKVYAFEPVPFLYDKLDLSRRENKFESFCEIYNCALSDAPGTLDMFFAIGAMNFGGSHLLDEPLDRTKQEGESVAVRTLDEVLSNEKIDFIKMDVEGAEPMVVKGGLELLARHKPIILCEVNNDCLRRVSRSNGDQLISTLTSLGYRCSRLLPDGTLGQELTGYLGEQWINVVFSA